MNGAPVLKAGHFVKPTDLVTLLNKTPKFVSRAGDKLDGALDHFGFDVRDLKVLDAGLSTGGFADCLLQRGAAVVYGVDVAKGIVHEKIAQNERVKLLEKTNLRHLNGVGELVDLVTLDLSFISILKVLSAVRKVLKNDGHLIAMIKPQFEAEKGEVGGGGIVRSEITRTAIAARVVDGIAARGFQIVARVDSSVEGTKGNKEVFCLSRKLEDLYDKGDNYTAPRETPTLKNN